MWLTSIPAYSGWFCVSWWIVAFFRFRCILLNNAILFVECFGALIAFVTPVFYPELVFVLFSMYGFFCFCFLAFVFIMLLSSWFSSLLLKKSCVNITKPYDFWYLLLHPVHKLSCKIMFLSYPNGHLQMNSSTKKHRRSLTLGIIL